MVVCPGGHSLMLVLPVVLVLARDLRLWPGCQLTDGSTYTLCFFVLLQHFFY